MSGDHQNPYASPQVEPAVRCKDTRLRIRSFFSLYAACFVGAVILWIGSRLFRKLDLLELPMTAMLFPLAMFIEPHDGLVNHPELAIPGGALCWLAVIPIAGRLAQTPFRRLLVAIGILATVGLLSIIYATLSI